MRDVIIIGAGPYGLAAAAQAKHAGLDYLLIGEPMSFWRTSMPSFMVVRSPFVASSIYSPQPGLSLDDFYRETGRTANKREKISLKIYLKYLDWYLEKAALNVLPQTVVALRRETRGTFTVTTGDGQQLESRAVVLAVGNPPFVNIPEEFKAIDKRYYSHACEVVDFSPFAGKKVLVLGAGQSAIEACLGLLQVGAQTELMHNQSGIYWHNIPLRINVPLLLFFLSFPTVLEFVPYVLRKPVGDMVSKPTVDKWLRPKIESRITEHTRARIERLTPDGDRLRVKFSGGRETTVDHVILGTGYVVDILSLPMLDVSVSTDLQVRHGYPLIDRHLESSIKGMFFTGVPAKGRFGPTFNFIFASPAGGKRVIAGVQARLQKS